MAMLVAGWRCNHVRYKQGHRPTLAAWLRTANPRRAHILVVRNHYIAVAGDQVADSGWMYSRTPQPLDTAPHLSSDTRN